MAMTVFEIEWIASGTLVIEIEVDEEVVKSMLDAPPCDLEDLPQEVQGDIAEKISESIFDERIKIAGINKVESAKDASSPRETPEGA